MNAFLNGLTNATNYRYTENGALTHKSTRSALLDMFAMGAAYRTRSDEDVILLFKNAFEDMIIGENPNFVINSLISVFPNPSNGNVNVNIETIGEVCVEVYDHIGKLLYSNIVTRYYISELNSFLDGLSSGVYLIKVNDDENNQTVKLVKY